MQNPGYFFLYPQRRNVTSILTYIDLIVASMMQINFEVALAICVVPIEIKQGRFSYQALSLIAGMDK